MNIICSILFMIDVGNGVGWQVRADVQGKIVVASESNYVVDFRKGLKEYPLTIEPNKYNKVIVSKDKCVKL